MPKKIARLVTACVCSLLVYAVLLLIVFGVVWRYLFNSPIMWVEELANVMYIWIVFIGAAICFAEREMVRMDYIQNLFSEKGRRIIDIAFDIIAIVGCSCLVPYGVKLVSSVIRVKSIILQFSWIYLYLPALLIVAWIAAVSVYNLVRDIRSLRR